MSIPAGQQPPAVTIAQNSFTTHSSHGSIGPLIAVLVFVMVLGIVSVLVGKLCSGRRIFGYGPFDIERWAEAHCSSCIYGRLSPPSRTNPVHDSVLSSMATQSSQEIKNKDDDDVDDEEDEDHDPQHSNGNV